MTLDLLDSSTYRELYRLNKVLAAKERLFWRLDERLDKLYDTC